MLIEDLQEKDVGRLVEYNDGFSQPEKGKIKSWNDKYIFVVYKCANNWDEFNKYTGVATSPEDLTFISSNYDNSGKYEQKKEKKEHNGKET